MTFEEHLAELKRKQPSLFQAERINISVKSLEEQLRWAYRRGQESVLSAVPDPPPFFEELCRGFKK